MMQGTAEPEVIPLESDIPTEGSNATGATKPGPKSLIQPGANHLDNQELETSPAFTGNEIKNSKADDEDKAGGKQMEQQGRNMTLLPHPQQSVANPGVKPMIAKKAIADNDVVSSMG